MEKADSIRDEKILDIVRALPALLLGAVTLFILIMDLATPAMKGAQYLLYPVAIRIAGFVGLVCAAVSCISDINSEKGGLRPNRYSLPFVIFAVLIAASTAFNGISHNAVFGVAYRYVGVFDIFVYMAAYMYCSARLENGRLKRLIFLLYILISDLIALAFLYHMYISSIPAFEGKVEPAGMFFHGNHYGYFLVIAIVLSAVHLIYGKGPVRAAGLISMVLNIVALMVNRTMGALLTVSAVVLLMMVLAVIRGDEAEKKASVVMLVCSVVSVSLAFAFSSGLRGDVMQIVSELAGIAGGDNNIYAGNGRWGIWQFVAGLVAARPLLGYGCEGIKDVLLDYALTASPHNEPLTYAAYFGIPAAVIYCAGVIQIIIKSLRGGKSRDKSGIGTGSGTGGSFGEGFGSGAAGYAALGYFLSSVLGLAVFYTAPFMFVMLGMAMSRDR